MTEFFINQIVCYEMAKEGNIPRYNFKTDYGPSGKWETGKVVEIFKDMKTMFVASERNGRTWGWPLPEHEDWDDTKQGWIKPSMLNGFKQNTLLSKLLERRKKNDKKTKSSKPNGVYRNKRIK